MSWDGSSAGLGTRKRKDLPRLFSPPTGLVPALLIRLRYVLAMCCTF